MKILVVGGVAGGAGAAAKARRVNEDCEIVVYEKGPYVSFANCGLPYFVGGDIARQEDLLLQTPESLWRRFRIKVHVFHEVLSIDRAQKKVEIKDLSSGKCFSDGYDTLILAPGARAIVPDVPGVKSSNVFPLKTVPEAAALKTFIQNQKPRKAVVIGAGFIGLEAAEALAKRGLDVTLVEKLSQVLPPLDEEMARFMSDHLIARGVRIVLQDGLKGFEGSPPNQVVLESGQSLPMDLAVLSIGVRPEVDLAKQAGLILGHTGAIAVNDHQQTSDPAIYAVGDAVELNHIVTGKPARMALAGPANKQGRVAGANAAGGNLVFKGSLGTSIVGCLGYVAAKTGLSEREARAEGFTPRLTYTHPPHHATYFPGSQMMHVKLISDEASGRLLGAQILGVEGVDKRIDVLASAIFAGLSLSDIEQLDLAYAPSFSSAKDPVVMAGFVAANQERQETRTLTWAELKRQLASGAPLQLVDVRTPGEHRGGALPGSILIPLDDLRERWKELNPAQPVVVYCRVGFRGYLAERILRQKGFQVSNLSGGYLSTTSASPPPPPPPVGRDETLEISKLLVSGKTLWDVRTPGEFRYENIPGTRNVPLTELLKEAALQPQGTTLYLLCQTGLRSDRAAQLLREKGFKACNVPGGLDAWKKAGGAVQRTKGGTLPVNRQVQMVAGGLVLLGALIPSWHLLAAVVGGGLFFAGISGFCGMATFLEKMPWNSPSASKKGPGDCCPK